MTRARLKVVLIASEATDALLVERLERAHG
jgi:hypothetical protein